MSRQKAPTTRRILADYSDLRHLSTAQIRALSEVGNPIAQHILGTHYANGTGGVRRNAKTAVRWYRVAAAGGNDRARYDLASLLENGADGVPKNNAAAMDWYLNCMQRGGEFAPRATLAVALMWRRGATLPGTNAQEMLRLSHSLVMLAAEAGEGRAMLHAAANFLIGRGVEKDRQRGVDFLVKAASIGQVEAQAYLERIKT